LAIRLSTIDFVTYSCCIELGGAVNVEGVTAVAHHRLVQKHNSESGWADHFAQNQEEECCCNAVRTVQMLRCFKPWPSKPHIWRSRPRRGSLTL